MIAIVFWDYIPVNAVLMYQCSVNAGLKVYKSPKAWLSDNIGDIGAVTIRDIPTEYLVSSTLNKKTYHFPNGDVLNAYYKGSDNNEFNYAVYDTSGKGSRKWINQRLALVSSIDNVWHIIDKRDEKIIDKKNGEVLVRIIDYSAKTSIYNAHGIEDYKAWFDYDHCSRKNAEQWDIDGKSFIDYLHNYENIAEE